MRGDKAIAINLRLQSKSYNEISGLLKVSKSTLSGWFRENPRSVKIRKALTLQSNQERGKALGLFNALRWQKWREEARIEARKEFQKLADNPLFIAGLMLYWGEGDSKPQNAVKLTNTNAQMIALYIKFLLHAMKVPKEKIKAAIILYPDLIEQDCLAFWAKTTGLPLRQFHKTQVIQGRHKTNRLQNGICMITFSSRQLKEKMLVWIDLLSKKL
jgi:hypothetical protein